MAAEEGEATKNPPIPPKRSSTNSAMGMKESILSPGFRSAAAMAGWDEEALLASLVVEDTPVRESGKHKKRHTHHHLKSPPTTNSNRKRRSRRRSPGLVPPVVLCLDDDEEEAIKEDDASAKSKEMGTIAVDEEKNNKGERASPEKATSKGLPCMDRLREELSCAICLEICYEPSTTPCGHSFCRKCLKCAATRCGRRCPKCRQLISNGRSCSINTVLWNTIQLLFPEEVEARKSATATTPQNSEVLSQSHERSNSNSRVTNANTNTRIGYTRRATYVSQAIEIERSTRRNTVPSQSEDAALAYRLQREEFMEAFQGTRAHQRHVLNAARANLRAMASRAIQIRSRGRPT